MKEVAPILVLILFIPSNFNVPINKDYTLFPRFVGSFLRLEMAKVIAFASV